MLIPKVIYQDDQILVIDKPSGLVVNRAKSVRGKTLQDWIEKKFKINSSLRQNRENYELKIASEFVRRSGIVHRLDKDTSGVMIVAKTLQAFTNLQRQFKQRKVRKKYLALTHGKVEPKVGDIRMPLGRQSENRKKFTVRLGGRQAETKYQVLKIIDDLSLVVVTPKTGRTHQIRVHLKHIDHPLVADPIYLGKKRLKQDQTWCPRLFLHAHSLSFFHPQTKKRLIFKARLPEDLHHSLQNHFGINFAP